MREWRVGPEESPMRLDRWLAKKADISRSQVKKAIEEGRLTTNGRAVKASEIIQTGRSYILEDSSAKLDALQADPGPLNIRYEDPWLLVVCKPQGQLTHPLRGDDLSSLASALLAHSSLADLGDPLRPGIVHRLDRDSSGLLLVAKDPDVGKALQAAIRENQIDRRYLAMVEGRPDLCAFEVGNYLTKNRKNPLKRSVQAEAVEGGLWARSLFQLLFYNREHSLLSCQLDTGRTHQLRAQLAHAGLPIVGDPLYGQAQNSFGFRGQALHAHYLAFTHPITQQYLRICAPPPSRFRRAMKVVAEQYRKERGR